MKSFLKQIVRLSVLVVIYVISVLIPGPLVYLSAEPPEAGLGAFGYNVRDFGALGDGNSPDTFMIQNAVEQVKEDGGGQIYFPPGTYLTGTIYLVDNLSIYLSEGARIIGLPYDHPHYSRRGETPAAMLEARNVENVSLRGRGIVDGGGVSSGCNTPGCASRSIRFQASKHILVEGITILNGGQTALELYGSHDVVIRSILMDTNRDGIHIDGTNIRISDSVLNSDEDDVLVFKSVSGNGRHFPTSNVSVSNVYVSGYRPGSVYDGSYRDGGGVGRVKFGTGSKGGGFRNVTISNVIFDKCHGIHMSLVDGGVLENITFSNIVMDQVANSPIYIRLGDRDPSRAPKNPPPGRLQNITIDNLVATGANSQFTSVISGIPGHNIKNVTLSNIRILYTGGGTGEMAMIVPPENIGIYPEPGHFGKIPSYGFYVRHAEDIQLTNVVVGFEEPDERPAFIFRDVNDVQLYGIKAQRTPSGKPPIEIRGRSAGVQIFDSPSISTVPVRISRLRPSSEEVAPDESFTVILSAEVEEAGLAEIGLLVDDDLRQTKYRWLIPGRTEEIVFDDLRLYRAGEHRLRVGDLTAGISVKPSGLEFEITELKAWSPWVDDLSAGTKIESTVLSAREPALVGVKVRNRGGLEGEIELILMIDGIVTQTRRVHLEGGESKEVRFETIFAESGEHILRVNELEAPVYAWNKPGAFAVSDVRFVPAVPVEGEPARLILGISDTEYFFGSSVVLYQGDRFLGQRLVMAGTDEAVEIEFELPPQVAGTRTFTIRNLEQKSMETVSVRIRERLKPAKLRISSETVAVNEPLIISAIAENEDAEEAVITYGLSVDGQVVESREITIEPESSSSVQFSVRFYELGDLQVTIDQLPPMTVRVVRGLPGKDVEYSDLQVSRRVLLPDETFEVSSRIKNITADRKQLKTGFRVNEELVPGGGINLSPGESRRVSFRHRLSVEGEYLVGMGDQPPVTIHVGLNDIPSEFSSSTEGGHELRVRGNPLWVEGRFGKGVQFVWPENWADLSPEEYNRLEASIGPNDLGDAATVVLWYKPSWDYRKRETFREAIVENHVGFTLFEAGNGVTKRMFHLMWGDEGEYLSFNLEDSSDRDYEAPDDPATRGRDLGAVQEFFADRWYHIAATWDFIRQPHRISLFVDGQRVAHTEIEGQALGEFEDFTFGAHRHQFQAVGSAHGVLDDIRGYSRVLTDDEIQQLSDGTLDPAEEPFFHFSFDE